MKKLILLTLVVLALGAGRLSCQSVSTHFDKATDFSKYKTYKWVPIKDAQQLDELTSGQLTGTLEVELAKKGLKKTDSDTADLFIGYQVAHGKEKQLSNYNIGFSSGSTGGSSGTAAASTTVVHSGQLILDMYDSSNKQLVWRGIVSNAIEADAKPSDRQKQMDKAIEKLLKTFPPTKK